MTMEGELSRKQLGRLYLPPADDFVITEVPRMKFAMVDGEGNPEGPTHVDAVRWLFAAVYPIKRIAKERMGRSFIEPPLEGLWWAEDMADFVAGNKDKLKWRMMIPAPNWANEDMFAEAVAEASKRRGDAPESLRLENFEEGRSVQIMCVGPPAEKARPIVVRLHETFLPTHDLVPNGPHHEIYLTDSAPDGAREAEDGAAPAGSPDLGAPKRHALSARRPKRRGRRFARSTST